MPDVLALSATPALARLRSPELEVAVADDAADARASTLGRLGVIQRNLGVTQGVIDALGDRIKLRRPLPPFPLPDRPIPLPPTIEPLQSLVRRARRRLETERLGATRTIHDTRLGAVIKLRSVLET